MDFLWYVQAVAAAVFRTEAQEKKVQQSKQKLRWRRRHFAKAVIPLSRKTLVVPRPMLPPPHPPLPPNPPPSTLSKTRQKFPRRERLPKRRAARVQRGSFPRSHSPSKIRKKRKIMLSAHRGTPSPPLPAPSPPDTRQTLPGKNEPPPTRAHPSLPAVSSQPPQSRPNNAKIPLGKTNTRPPGPTRAHPRSALSSEL